MRTKTFEPWQIVAIRNWGGAIRSDPTHSSELRRASWFSFDAVFGAGWSAFTPGEADGGYAPYFRFNYYNVMSRL